MLCVGADGWLRNEVLLKSPSNCYDYSNIKSTAVVWEIATLASARSQRLRWCLCEEAESRRGNLLPIATPIVLY